MTRSVATIKPFTEVNNGAATYDPIFADALPVAAALEVVAVEVALLTLTPAMDLFSAPSKAIGFAPSQSNDGDVHAPLQTPHSPS